MRPVNLTKQLTGALDRDGIAQAQQRVGAGDLVLNGALSNGGAASATGVAALQHMTNGVALALAAAFTGLARTITLTSTADLSAISFTIVGTDANNNPLTDTRAGPNNSTVSFTGSFKTVTSITPNATDGVNNVSAGWATFSGTGTLGSQRIVGIYSAGNLSGVTFTVYGTNDAGVAISEAITGPNNATVSSLLNYATVTRVATSASVASDVEVGVTDVGASPPVPLDIYLPFGNTTSVDVSGTVNYTVQVTNDDPFQAADVPLNWVSYPAAALVAATTDQTANTAVAYRALRLLINSGVAAARMTVTQQGLLV